MTQVNSWIQLLAADDELKLSKKLCSEDAFNGVDIGWVSQMRPFIKEFSKPGDIVLDPFVGIGTTLVAAQLEKRVSIGIEMEHSRIKLIKERWKECGFNKADLNVIQGDCISGISKLVRAEGKPFIDFCITSVPYFGSEWQGNKEEGQLYSKTRYADYLNYMKQLFFTLKKVIKRDSYLVFMAENTRSTNGTLLPIAWDLGKSLAKYFNVYDERIITYVKRSEILKKPSIHTNRAHEYAIVVKNEETFVSLTNGVNFLTRLNKQGFEFIVYGSFSALIKEETQYARDIDLIMLNDEKNKLKVLTMLITNEFDIYCNGLLINQELLEREFDSINKERYFRCLTADSIKQLDIVFLDECEYKKIGVIKNTSFMKGSVAKEYFKLNKNWTLS